MFGIKLLTKLTWQTGMSVYSARNTASLLSLKPHHHMPVHALKEDDSIL